MQDTVGVRDVNLAGITLIDAQGPRAQDFPFDDPGCQSAGTETVLNAGQAIGPTPLCFESRGPVAERLTLAWQPDTVEGAMQVVHIPIP
jgi:hypothetical protein